MTNALDIRDLRVSLPSSNGSVTVVDGVSLNIPKGSTLGLVGESGCGKSVLSLAVMQLLPPGSVTEGQVLLGETDLLRLRPDEVRALRGPRVGMVFQEPMTSLNPMLTIGFQIEEAIVAHERRVDGREARARALEILARVRMTDPERVHRAYPHELSGGMRQRAMIAQALVCRPALLIADEPTTALDVTVQAEILALLRDLQRELGMSLLLITHDLGVVRDMADEVVVMYAGRIAERAPKVSFFSDAQHPYSLGLLGSVPRVDMVRDRLVAIEGSVPPAGRMPSGCRFHQRCPLSGPVCADGVPPLRRVAGHVAACHFAPIEEHFA